MSILQASFQGDLEALSNLLHSGAPYLEADSSGRTALHWAVTRQRLDMVTALVSHHNAHKYDNPPLKHQFYTLTYDEIEDLLRKKSVTCFTPIELAAEAKNEAIFTFLLENLDVPAPWPPQMNPVWPTLNSSDDALRRLYPTDERQSKVAVNKVEGEVVLNRQTLTHLAVKDDKFAVFSMLIQQSIDTQYTFGPEKLTTLHMAAALGHDRRYIQLLLDFGADPNVTDGRGHTPLALAVNGMNEEAVKALLQFGASPNVFDEEFGFPLSRICDLALRYKSDPDPDLPLRIMRALLEKGADANAKNDKSLSAMGRLGGTALHVAATNETTPRYVQELMSWGGRIDATDAANVQVLHYFAVTTFRTIPGTVVQPFLETFDAMVTTLGTQSQFEAIWASASDFGGGHDVDVEVRRHLCVPWVARPDWLEMGDPWAAPETVYLLERLASKLRTSGVVAALDCVTTQVQLTRPYSSGYTVIGWMVDELLAASAPAREAALDTFIHLIGILDQAGVLLDESGIGFGHALRTIVEFWEGDGLEPMVQTMLDVGSTVGCQYGGGSDCRFEDLEIVAIAAAKGKHSLVSILLGSALTAWGQADQTQSYPSPIWLSHFIQIRPDYDSDTSAVLACVEQTRARYDATYLNHPSVSWGVQKGDIEGVRALLADPNSKISEQELEYAFNCAISNGQDGPGLWVTADESYQPPVSFTPLHYAVCRGKPAIVRQLLEFGADIEARVKIMPRRRDSIWDGKTALEIALLLTDGRLGPPLHPSRLAVAQVLLEQGAAIPARVAKLWKSLDGETILNKFSGFPRAWDIVVKAIGEGELDGYESEESNEEWEVGGLLD
ncbi:hypothetical protein BKA70DRAFT_553991 [Coprinopsis sp. MPI-PUGE-AT-0042]|nr:hypothetical protein BKA70DRAFT_553991 [Coprinopsis sp. MPI-PUGE-AT-0042]